MDLCHEEERDGWTDSSGGGGECMGTCFPARATLERKFLIHLALKIFAKILSCAFRICFLTHPCRRSLNSYVAPPSPLSVPTFLLLLPPPLFLWTIKFLPSLSKKETGVGREREGGSDSGDFLPSFFGHCTTLLIRVCVGLGMH